MGFCYNKSHMWYVAWRKLFSDLFFFFFFLINLNWTLSDKAVASLKESEKLLLECTEGDYKDNSTSLECLRDIKVTSKDISQQLSG